ncbi:rhamnogalacturonan lyase [Tuwongella immobilis]|uniref:FG-GAP repeat domain protein n=1 Tax=Tuwongella immobilis TaxID=692036 RepID=A0A6C2YHE9_9BACT|nr:rhamnogalacturonan lyase [Tuwongella immobilis]VIP00950.1 FG-GAP repeat domain protein OS=Bacillus subtilis subsp. spizizenii (strain TU-B-10) GN=GYO_0965 PE=4 SV=1 [Tuwongella immobilis]VTR97318.1 FG-GAP repeat domain protein OS=Bacillus subtilis subsp. spizizenii (strain TU-B-10) GN=GYO_0965 PE=4 SV=1 [Tuwongella immobilis]
MMRGWLAGILGISALALGHLCGIASAPPDPSESAVNPPRFRILERLDRGLIALRTSDTQVTLSWRLLATDPESIAFEIDRQIGSQPPTPLCSKPLSHATFWQDSPPDFAQPITYTLRAAAHANPQVPPLAKVTIPAQLPIQSYLRVPIQVPASHTPNDGSVGDLDGDGQLEIVLKSEQRPRDNSQPGDTGETLLDAYRLDGTQLWRIHLGPNIREGAHYTQFLVYDFDGDGRAEVMLKTADGTRDGTGQILGDPQANHRNEQGFILTGPEFLTVFEGATGKALATVDYLPARGTVRDWGDAYGNRVDRFLAGVAYLDGERPSAIFSRGYYTRTVLVAWDFREGKLTRRWTFDSNRANRAVDSGDRFDGQGDHSLSIADIDADGCDEIIFGAMTIDHNGQPCYSTNLGHGDALHVSDFDPARQGQEVFNIHEKRPAVGVSFRDAKSGATLWSKASGDVGRGMIADIDPRYPGAESWAAGPGLTGVWDCTGKSISRRRPRATAFVLWWDGDPLRELLDRNRISKWNPETESESTLLVAENCLANNGSKGSPVLVGDLLGDWREEVVLRSSDNRELRIFTTPIPTEQRMVTLLHDAQYRCAIAWQNVGYNQPPHPSFFLGHGMGSAPWPRIRVPSRMNDR